MTDDSLTDLTAEAQKIGLALRTEADAAAEGLLKESEEFLGDIPMTRGIVLGMLRCAFTLGALYGLRDGMMRKSHAEGKPS